MNRRLFLGAALAAPALLRTASARAATPVDVELVLAVDVSRSVDPEEQEMQFSGYEAAFRDPRLIEGIMGGPLGSIACTMFTWSDWHIQNTVVPWMHLNGPEAANRFADAIANAPRRTWLYTSISGAIDHAAKQFGQGFEGTRKVVDISGDGVNNSGRPLAEARAEALEQGIVLNGLAVLDRTPTPLSLAAALPPLDDYYRNEVIGGPGAFLVVAEGFEAFDAAVRRKIIREIAAVPAPGPQIERFA
ncbi:DUF1194 domain-containing protein [Siccirubricoccus sp. KC 17139]|uniref:DUF1194 domain-containing protein n=1 Tax=Siccirubricoccus soli TaxID=2899147 RepID=A0ABT1D4H3_9PROT|nr:DUF1194 domain-containing protein [Siccirubricoccus soli]MCO6416818.1 DUF1194 domain-containing protein [Siccirubricoccus soli]MCP2682953.1 DUF1194 domain-containing protein [Siccirubricoccus soli]